MWTCIKCNKINDDLYPICSNCSASRSAGRFGSAAPARVVPYPPEPQGKPKTEEPAPAPAPQSAPPAPEYIPNPDGVRAGGGVRFFGRLLMLLLPLLTAAAAFLKYNSTKGAIALLLSFGNTAQNVSDIWIIAVYVLFSLGAVLLSLLPGLWTLCIGKLLHRFARMEELL
ncbi:MAG: hypothetical protein IKW00_07190 [Clostridia bacterium]|nr:hypothetical protein [Clostridia bacterium]